MAAYRVPGGGGTGGKPTPRDVMTDDDLQAMLAAQKADALSSNSESKLLSSREKALDYYYGEMPDMLPAEGRSKAVSTDVADTIEGLMPSLMDIFAGSDEVVRFEPVGPEDEAAAQQETDYVNHVFMQQNPGFMVLYSFIKDALLSSPVLSERSGLVSRRRLENDSQVDQCTGFARSTGMTMRLWIRSRNSMPSRSSTAPPFRSSITAIGGSFVMRQIRLRLRVSSPRPTHATPVIFVVSAC
jgi:hypothetical protein